MENYLSHKVEEKGVHLLINTQLPSEGGIQTTTTLTKKFKVKITSNPKQKRTKTKKDGIVFAIEGVHGVGKTTLYQILDEQFKKFPNIKFFPERMSEEPPVPFGSKDQQTAFRSEIYYNQQMIQRNEQVKRFIKNQRENIVILDRSPLSTLVYSRALCLPKIDYDLIQNTFISIDWNPEYILYLEAEPKTLMERICRRGCLDAERKKWNEEDFQYLKRVLDKYEEVFLDFKIKEDNRLYRIWTENRTPADVATEILKTIEKKTGLQITKTAKIPKNQMKLTEWF